MALTVFFCAQLSQSGYQEFLSPVGGMQLVLVIGQSASRIRWLNANFSWFQTFHGAHLMCG